MTLVELLAQLILKTLYGFGFVWVSHHLGDVNSFIREFKQRITDCHIQNWSQSGMTQAGASTINYSKPC